MSYSTEAGSLYGPLATSNMSIVDRIKLIVNLRKCIRDKFAVKVCGTSAFHRTICRELARL